MVEFTVNTSIPITFEKIEDLVDKRFTKVKIWLMHTGKNLNNSVFDKSVIEDALPSLANIPILGFIQVDSTNQTDFKGHEQRLVIDDNGISIEYLGRAYGVIGESNNAKFEKKTGSDGIEREYLTVEGLLWNKFQESIDIFDRDGFKSQSMELAPHSIKGEFKSDGAFHFTSFLFEGACILGDNVTPAMKGSIIEKIDFTTQANVSFQSMIAEFNALYSEISQSNKVDLYKNNQEGGNGVNELLEVFSQYPTLTEEDVAEIKANLEQYSVETLKEKLDELVANKESSNTQVEDQFENNEEQTEEKAEGQVTEEQKSEDYETVEESESDKTSEFELLQTEVENLKKFNEELQNEITNLKDQISELTSYKLAREKQDKLDVIKNFAHLTDEEKQPFIDNVEKYSADELEEKLFALVGKKGITSFSKQPKDNLKVSLVNYKSTNSNQPEWVQWVEQYKAKNN